MAIPSFIDKCKSLYEDNSSIFLNNLFSLCKSCDLQVNYDKTSTNKLRRIILKTIKNTNVHPLIYYYSNGLVIDTEIWAPISVPPLAFNKRQLLKEVNNNIEHYEVLPITDGTVVTIYKWKNKWHIASSNSYDISGFYWIGKKTYAEIIYDLFTKFAPDCITTLGIQLDDNGLDFGTLNSKYCYTIGIRHHDFHPLLNDPEKIWNIQKVKLSTLTVIYNDGIPGIPKQTIITPPLSIVEINNINKSSIHDAMKSDPIFNYGYILRSINPDITGEFSSILLDSGLLKEIRKNIYDYPSNVLRQYITNENRLDFIILKNYFNKLKKNEILRLYPQFLTKYNKYSICIDETIKCITNILKVKNGEKIVISTNIHIEILAQTLLKYIIKFDNINLNNPDFDLILRDYIMNMEYAVLFIDTINAI